MIFKQDYTNQRRCWVVFVGYLSYFLNLISLFLICFLTIQETKEENLSKEEIIKYQTNPLQEKPCMVVQYLLYVLSTCRPISSHSSI